MTRVLIFLLLLATPLASAMHSSGFVSTDAVDITYRMLVDGEPRRAFTNDSEGMITFDVRLNESGDWRSANVTIELYPQRKAHFIDTAKLATRILTLDDPNETLTTEFSVKWQEPPHTQVIIPLDFYFIVHSVTSNGTLIVSDWADQSFQVIFYKEGGADTPAPSAIAGLTVIAAVALARRWRH